MKDTSVYTDIQKSYFPAALSMKAQTSSIIGLMSWRFAMLQIGKVFIGPSLKTLKHQARLL